MELEAQVIVPAVPTPFFTRKLETLLPRRSKAKHGRGQRRSRMLKMRQTPTFFRVRYAKVNWWMTWNESGVLLRK